MRRHTVAALNSLGDLLPGRNDYRGIRTSFRADLFAGITVGVVALPLALAFGVSSGVGPAAGLITAVIAGIVAAVFGGSSVQVSGPTGAMAVVLAPIVATHGVGVVPLVAILGGIMVLVAGVLRLGRVVTFVPWPVVEGFTLGIAAIIFLQQVPNAVGVDAPIGENTLGTALRSLTAINHTALWTLGTVLLVAVLTVVLPKLHSALPASLIAVAIATVLAELLSAPVSRIGELPSSLPLPVMPSVDLSAVQELIGAAGAIAILAAIESLLSARVAASMHGNTGYQPDRELVGQGMASIASGFFGGMPATGAIARTAVNVRSGAQTRVAALVHSLVILAVIYLATGPVSRIPLAALAGVLMVTTFKMVSGSTIRSVMTSTRTDATVFVITAVITVTVDLIQAVQIGLAIAGIFTLYTLARMSTVARQDLPVVPEDGDDKIALFQIDGALFFGVAEKILSEITAVRDVEVVILRLSMLRMLDATGARTLSEIVQELERRNITVLVKGVQERHLKMLQNVGVLRSLRHQNHIFDDIDPAIEHARSHVKRNSAHDQE